MQEVFYTVIEWLFWIGIFIVFYTYLGYGILLYVLVKVKELFKISWTRNLTVNNFHYLNL